MLYFSRVLLWLASYNFLSCLVLLPGNGDLNCERIFRSSTYVLVSDFTSLLINIYLPQCFSIFNRQLVTNQLFNNCLQTNQTFLSELEQIKETADAFHQMSVLNERPGAQR